MNSANQHTDDIPASGYADGGGRYSPFQLGQKYIRYYLTAANGKGHGIHSPFVFDLIKNVLNDTRVFPEYAAIERLRKYLESDPAILQIEDMGAGSALGGASTTILSRSVADIARRMAKPKKLGQLLFRLARYYRPETVLELGTSLGLSTAYLAAGAGRGEVRAGVANAGATAENRKKRKGVAENSVDMTTEDRTKPGGATERARVFTIEGAPGVGAVAKNNFRALGLENIDLTIGNFDRVLDATLDRAGRVDLAFIDGNHRLEPTLRYFNALYGKLSPSSVLIFDDIHWSREMEAAWESIKKDPRVYLSVDLFFIGLVFFRDNFKVKQDFVIRF
jgi:predicted O-methyltransferase YrrM